MAGPCHSFVKTPDGSKQDGLNNVDTLMPFGNWREVHGVYDYIRT